MKVPGSEDMEMRVELGMPSQAAEPTTLTFTFIVYYYLSKKVPEKHMFLFY